ncbi:MAG: triose-phosphate isomerase [Clostridia bacterium]|nr:triose-phosphate isomerase [Clostridia bacterium]
MKYLFGNWKMNMSLTEIEQFAKQFKYKSTSALCVGVAVPSVYFETCKKLSKKVLVGLQNVSQFEVGAFTGEISAKMQKDISVDFCLVGHSERRQYFNETNEVISDKILRLQQNDILPVLCIGESLEQFEANKTKQVLSQQIKKCTSNLDATKDVILAYEPVWAIGTGKSASLDYIDEICGFIKSEFLKLHNKNCSVLYGGSVNPQNSADIANLKNVDGVLVGGASQDANKFMQIYDTFR